MEMRDYIQRPVRVKAARLTEDNVKEVAAELDSEIYSNGDYDYIRVPILRRGMAVPVTSNLHVGQWYVQEGRFKYIYGDEEFNRTFALKEPDPAGTERCPDCHDLILARDMESHKDRCLRQSDGACRKCGETIPLAKRWTHWANCTYEGAN